MVVVPLGLLGVALIGTTVGLHVEESRDLAPEIARGMIQELQQSLTAKGYSVEIEPRVGTTDERVVLHIVAALTVMRIRVERRGRDGMGRGSVELDRPIEAWSGAMQAVGAQLYPSPDDATTSNAVNADVNTSRPILPWILVGTGAAAAGVAAGFAISSAKLRSGVTSDAQYDPEGAVVIGTADTQSTVAVGLLVGGAVTLSVGILLAILTD